MRQEGDVLSYSNITMSTSEHRMESLTFPGAASGPALPPPAPVAAIDTVRWRFDRSLVGLIRRTKGQAPQ